LLPTARQQSRRFDLVLVSRIAGLTPLQSGRPSKTTDSPAHSKFNARATATLPSTSAEYRPLRKESFVAKFGSLAQMKAVSGEETDSADEAALHEAIVRSLQDKAFETLGSPRPEAHTGVGDALQRATSERVGQDSPSAKLSEVSDAEQATQMLGFAGLNKAFRAHLEKNKLQVISNEGKGTNCSIYALVQHIRPDLPSNKLDAEVSALREQYDKGCPQDRGKMLHFDTRAGGTARSLIGLVNKRFGVNIQLGMVEAGMDQAHPATLKESIAASMMNSSFTHRLIIWDQQGHCEALTAKPDDGKSSGNGVPTGK